MRLDTGNDFLFLLHSTEEYKQFLQTEFPHWFFRSHTFGKSASGLSTVLSKRLSSAAVLGAAFRPVISHQKFTQEPRHQMKSPQS